MSAGLRIHLAEVFGITLDPDDIDSTVAQLGSMARMNVTFYDAAYVALAEALQVTLLTGDRRLSQAAGPTCPMETVAH